MTLINGAISKFDSNEDKMSLYGQFLQCNSDYLIDFILLN
jgi:hypothetical protein